MGGSEFSDGRRKSEGRPAIWHSAAVRFLRVGPALRCVRSGERPFFLFLFRTILCTSDACVVVCSDAIRRVAMRVRIVLCEREREREGKEKSLLVW